MLSLLTQLLCCVVAVSAFLAGLSAWSATQSQEICNQGTNCECVTDLLFGLDRYQNLTECRLTTVDSNGDEVRVLFASSDETRRYEACSPWGLCRHVDRIAPQIRVLWWIVVVVTLLACILQISLHLYMQPLCCCRCHRHDNQHHHDLYQSQQQQQQQQQDNQQLNLLRRCYPRRRCCPARLFSLTHASRTKIRIVTALAWGFAACASAALLLWWHLKVHGEICSDVRDLSPDLEVDCVVGSALRGFLLVIVGSVAYLFTQIYSYSLDVDSEYRVFSGDAEDDDGESLEVQTARLSRQIQYEQSRRSYRTTADLVMF
eukprot:TRINITY_DN9100_c1_g1_i1.p1 TRINITY_DN9100_c1_g1~~TRINITY_DN9100_c1_g1_i1.p1  ORF type:complete len:324 (+),score=59.41 TRINITY_DN9100_c1_g1_i1:23-973(+)